MTAGLLGLDELAVESGVPAERLRNYADAGLLAPTRGDGYSAAEVATVRVLAGAEDLGLGDDTVAELATDWRDGECAGAHERLAGAVRAQLDRVHADLAEQQRRATTAGPGTDAWAEANRTTVSLAEDAARLQAVGEALAATPHGGPCGPSCGCATALAAAGTTFHFPGDAGGDADLSCDLAADGGEARDRIGMWQQVLARVDRRETLADADSGVALRFPFDVDLAATLARLAAAEYRCCSFGSYTIVIDESGLRLEVRMPAGAEDMLAAVVGRPDPPATALGDGA